MKSTNNSKKEFLFKSSNYKLLFLSIFTIIFGFIVMSGGGSDDPEVFNEEIYNWQRIRLAPTLVLLGLAIEIYAILADPKK